MSTFEKRREPRIEFLGEQDGVPERELKTALIDELRRFRSVKRAYLARIGFAPDAVPSVALCLVPSSRDDRKVVQAVSRLFASLFSADIHLDILFIDEQQEADLQRVCRAFL